MRGRRTDRNFRSDQLTSSAHLLRKWVQLGSRESTRKSRAARSIGRACSTASVASQPDFLVSLPGEIKCAFGALDFLPTMRPGGRKLQTYGLSLACRVKSNAPSARLISFRQATL